MGKPSYFLDKAYLKRRRLDIIQEEDRSDERRGRVEIAAVSSRKH
jgi:hypothetical protein